MEDVMATIAATLCDATHYRGTSVVVRPDGGGEGGEAIVYSLAHLGLNRLGSLRAPNVASDPGSPFRQELRWVVHVTVWRDRPRTGTPPEDQRGRSWQGYSADTADLGAWAEKAAYVRVWREPAGDPGHAAVAAPDAAKPSPPCVIVE
ncbi:hypothetical protein [Streptomyces sp. NRRL S-378]|uniref:hypothetical protein n=1 Tax=Streptomyces sp. NRRL S-378 TaxID=1463904 RepID=UPI0004CA1A60|nr:hypothetical protein [Streptomyces sp. NRRL S-378]